MLVYPDLATYRKIYSESAKQALDNDEVVFLVTTYDSFERIKDSLMQVGISVSNETKAGNLIIMDAIKAYQIDTYGAAKFVTTLVKKSETHRKAGVFALTEMGSFFIVGRIALLLEYETSLHKKLEIRLKATCTYHKDDFSALSNKQQETILVAHNTVIR
jgi:KaiC/GvpD/RAD55 family RecA-like ATPase